MPMYSSQYSPQVRRINTILGYENHGRSTASLNPSTYRTDNGQTGQMTSRRGGSQLVSRVATGSMEQEWEILTSCRFT
jgi:hypothetical protein